MTAIHNYFPCPVAMVLFSLVIITVVSLFLIVVRATRGNAYDFRSSDYVRCQDEFYSS